MTIAPTVPVQAAQATIALGASLSAVALGSLVAVAPVMAVVVVLGATTTAIVWRRPAVAAVLVVVLTPLTAGIDRGQLIPVLRPNEALTAGLWAVLVVRAAVQASPGWRPTVRLNRVELFLVAMALANSVVPIVSMLIRGRDVEPDDISYALVLWKYLAVYGLIRVSVKSQAEVRACLWAALGTCGVVAAIGTMQALDVLGVRAMLGGVYAPFGYTGALALPRGGSTLSLPAAAADLYVMNVVVALGVYLKDRRHPLLLGGIGILCVVGTFAAAEFSSVLGLMVAAVAAAWALRRLDLLRYAPVALVVGAVATLPVLEHRLTGFEGVAGMPVSWSTRWYNLTNYFWPELFSGSNPLWGVRPAARVPVLTQGTGYVWIESGFTWLLWGGGLLLLLAYLAFVVVSVQEMTTRCRPLDSYAAVAALAALATTVMVFVLMHFDPHLTYRGAADYMVTLLALAFVARGDETVQPPMHEALPLPASTAGPNHHRAPNGEST